MGVMAATPQQKRRQTAAHRLAVRIIRADHPDLWADAYETAKAVVADADNTTSNPQPESTP